MKIIVSDTGPLLHLSEAGALDLLKLAGEVYIPESVKEEFGYHSNNLSLQRPDWLKITPLSPMHKEQALLWQQAGLIHYGEAETIALAVQLSADWLLTDDAAARLFAKSFQLEVRGSLGVILWAAATGKLSRSDAETFLSNLIRSSLWLSPRVITEAQAALTKIYTESTI